jgi:adenosylmethionine-8-amino-7-oxononanoate aminotransferase
MRGDTDRYKVISRDIAYHGTTLGALTITSLESYRTPFEPLVPGAVKVPAVNFYRAEKYRDDFEAFGLWSARQIEEAILREGPDTVAAVFLESVQNAGGCFTPPPGYWQEVRSICDPSVASAPGSVLKSMTSCPTSSLARRASPRATPRWAP